MCEVYNRIGIVVYVVHGMYMCTVGVYVKLFAFDLENVKTYIYI